MSDIETAKSLSTLMQEAIDKQNLTPADVATALGSRLGRTIETNKVSGYLRGDWTPSIPTLWAFCDLIGPMSGRKRLSFFEAAADSELSQ